MDQAYILTHTHRYSLPTPSSVWPFISIPRIISFVFGSLLKYIVVVNVHGTCACGYIMMMEMTFGEYKKMCMEASNES